MLGYAESQLLEQDIDDDYQDDYRRLHQVWYHGGHPNSWTNIEYCYLQYIRSLTVEERLTHCVKAIQQSGLVLI